MSKICTSVEQSKKLVELGIDVNTADMALCGGTQLLTTNYVLAKKKFSNAGEISIEPAWSLSALLDLLPSSLSLYPEATEEEVKEGKYRSSDLIASKEGYLRKRYDGDYQYRYDGIKVVGDFQSPLDAVFEIICWLKENNRI